MMLLILIFALFLALYIKSKKYSFQRELKRVESPIEKIMLQALYQEGFKPYTQISVGYYRLDIGIYYKGRKIAIECDGKDFHTSNEQISRDRRRDEYLRKNNWIVLRFSGSEINRNAKACVTKIKTSV